MSASDQIDPALERKLAARAADGDSAAVADLYDAYERRLYGYCNRICRHPEDAADATQEAFCNVIQRLPGLDVAKLNFGAYLFTAARNACMDIVGQRRKAEPTDEVPEDPFATNDLDIDPERAILTQDQQRAAREANDRLPESQRSVLALREVSGLSYDEIAETMGMNSNSVAQLISRARLNFYKQLRTDAVIIPPLDDAAQRAIDLTVKRQDGKINSDDLDWLNAHLAENESSRLNAEAIQESAVLYRAIAPVAVLATLRAATLERAGTNRSEKGSETPGNQSTTNPSVAKSAPGSANTTTPPAEGTATSTADAINVQERRKRTRRAGAIALMMLLIALILAGLTDGGQPQEINRAAELFEPTPPTSAVKKSEAKKSEQKKQTTSETQSRSGEAPPQYSNGSPSSKEKSTSNDKPRSEEADNAEPEQPASTPPPTTPPPAEEPTEPNPTPPKKPPSGPGSICSPPYCTTPPPN